MTRENSRRGVCADRRLREGLPGELTFQLSLKDKDLATKEPREEYPG